MGICLGPSVNHIIDGMPTPLHSFKKALPDPRKQEQYLTLFLFFHGKKKERRKERKEGKGRGREGKSFSLIYEASKGNDCF